MPLFKTSFISKITIFLVAAMLSVSAMALDFNQTQRLANQENASAQYALGIIYYNGKGVRQDYTKTIEWFTKAANQEYADAQYALGAIYYNGQGVRQNTETAIEWFGKACDHGNQNGCKGYRELNQ